MDVTDWPKGRQLSKLSITYEKEEEWVVMLPRSSCDVIQEGLPYYCRLRQQFSNFGNGTPTKLQFPQYPKPPRKHWDKKYVQGSLLSYSAGQWQQWGGREVAEKEAWGRKGGPEVHEGDKRRETPMMKNFGVSFLESVGP